MNEPKEHKYRGMYPVVAEFHYKDKFIDFTCPIRIRKFFFDDGQVKYHLYISNHRFLKCADMLNLFTAIRWKENYRWCAKNSNAYENSLATAINGVQMMFTEYTKTSAHWKKIYKCDVSMRMFSVTEQDLDNALKRYKENKIIRAV